MQIDGEDIESLLANMMLIFFFKSHKSNRTTLHTFLLGNGLNKFHTKI
jgi:hypothetical protein